MLINILLVTLLSKEISSSSKSPDNFEYYENLIKTYEEKATTHVIEKDANIYKPRDFVKIRDFGTYDIIIVGAGASGTVIANRLSEIKRWKILLLEAGKFGNDFTNIPSMSAVTYFSNYTWGYESVPQKTACLGMRNQICQYPRGRGIGGTTLINILTYARGHPIDYDRWAALGNPGWSYKDVLPYFRKSEHFHKNNLQAKVDPNSHGYFGNLNVEYPVPTSKTTCSFFEANEELGYNLTDYNSPHELGYSPSQLTTKDGKRCDGGTAFIKPILHRKNLRVMTDSYATKININKLTKDAEGVTFSYKGELHEARVRHEVILSAGAIASPQILMLSGVGPEKHLREVGIPVIHNLEVGSKLQDHSEYYGLTFSTNYSEPVDSQEKYIEDYLQGYGPFSIPGANEAIGYYKTKMEKTTDFPDLELMFHPPNSTSLYTKRKLQWTDETWDNTWGNIDERNSFAVNVMALHTRSTGTLRLKSKNPFEYPLIDINMLSDPDNHDIDTIYEGIQFVLRLVNTEAFKKIDAKLQVKPLPACKEFEFLSKDYWYCAIRQLTFIAYHPIASCPMGPNSKNGDVVDSDLKVHGVRKLRVADASVIPFPLSGHPNAPCVMIGEKISDIVKRDNIKYWLHK